MAGDLLPFLVEWTVRASVLLGAAWTVTRGMRRASAATRHALWATAIASTAILPAASLILPRWDLPSPAALTPVTSIIASTTEGIVGSQGQTAFAGNARGESPTSSERGTVATPPKWVSSEGVSYANLAAGVWALGTAAVLTYMFVGFLAAQRLRRSSIRVDAAWVRDAQSLTDALSIDGRVTFCESAGAKTPLVCGIWRPTIVMPAGVQAWPRERRRSVVLHELAHVRRRDCLTQLLAQLTCALYWMNPLVWIAARCLRREREHACDDFVLSAGTRASDYAGHLLETARPFEPIWLPTPAGLAVAHRSQLEERLMAILDPRIRRSSARPVRLAAAAAMLLTSVPVAAVHFLPSDTARHVTLRSAAPPASVLMLQTATVATQSNFQWSGTLPKGQTVEVRGVNGSIRTVASNDEFIRVEAHIEDPSRTRIDVVQRETGIMLCSVSSTPRGQESECEPRRREGARSDGRVNFIIRVPVDVRFAASMIHGHIVIDGLRSPGHVATIDGNIAVELAAGQPVDFHANLISGTIESDFPVADSTPGLPSGDRPGGSMPRIVRATIGRGGPALVVATINGNVQLRRR